MTGRRALAACALVLGLGVASAARAQPEEVGCPDVPEDRARAEKMARMLFEDAVQREAADPQGALNRLICAQKAADRPAIALRIGTVAERLERYQTAIDNFRHYLELAGAAAPDAAEMKRHIEMLEKKLREPRTPTVPTATAAPTAAPPAGPDATVRTAGWIGAGAGAAFAVAGVVLLVSAKSKNDAVHAIPAGTVAWDSDTAKGQYETARTLQTVGLVALVTGITVGTVGAVLVVRESSKSPRTASRAVEVAATPTPGGAYATVGASF